MGEDIHRGGTDTTAKRRRGKVCKLTAHRDRLLELRQAENDLTLDIISERLLAEHGDVSEKSMLSRFFKAEGISFKKSVHASDQTRPDVAKARAE